MRKIIIPVIVAGCMLFFSLHPALCAGNTKHNLGFMVGVSTWPSDVFHYIKIYPRSSFRYKWRGMNMLEQEIHLKPIFSLHFQYNFGSRIGFQVELSHQRASYDVDYAMVPLDPASRIKPAIHHLEWNVTSVVLHAVFHGRRLTEPIVPYGFVGLGLCYVRGDRQQRADYEIEVHPSFDLTLKAGGGASFYPLGGFPLGLDLKVFIMVLGASLFGYYSPSGEGDLVGGGNIIAEGVDIIWGIKLGLKYRF